MHQISLGHIPCEERNSSHFENIEELSVLKIEPFTGLGTPAEIIRLFGSRENYLNAVKELENELYRVAA